MPATMVRASALALLLLVALCCVLVPVVRGESEWEVQRAGSGESARDHAEYMATLEAEVDDEMADEAQTVEDAAEELDMADELLAAPSIPSEQEAELAAAQAEAEETSELEQHSTPALVESHSSSTETLPHNAPILPAAHSPPTAKLTFKRNLPARLKFQRMVLTAQQKLEAQHPAPRALVTVGSTAATAAAAASDADGESDGEAEGGAEEGGEAEGEGEAEAEAGGEAEAEAETEGEGEGEAEAGGEEGGEAEGEAEGGEGGEEGGEAGGDDWTVAPPWWKPPPSEAVKPWQEDDYSYLLKHQQDTSSFITPSPLMRFAQHRLAGSPASVAGFGGTIPGSVHAYQSPGAPPLPELDANMQPTNNYPNAPFYEHNYHKEYIWG